VRKKSAKEELTVRKIHKKTFGVILSQDVPKRGGDAVHHTMEQVTGRDEKGARRKKKVSKIFSLIHEKGEGASQIRPALHTY